MEQILEGLERAIWGWPLLGLILGTGVFLMIRLRFLPLRRFGLALRLLARSGKGSGVTPFAALCTSLSAAIGTGNLVGVASAIALGGPGALFWMELSAVTGMAVKYAEGSLAIRYRETRPDGTHRGGPAHSILLGLGRRWKPLACAFAFFGAAAGLCGVGTFVQIGSVTACLEAWLSSCFPDTLAVELAGRQLPLAVVLLGLVLAVGTACFIFCGIGSISRLSSVLVPAMGGLYIVCCLWILLLRLPLLPAILRRILRTAFTPGAVGGGLIGTIRAGVSRGVFSNEAGLGTAPIAIASTDADSPAEQGLLSMTAAVFDTVLICTLTGLVILSTGASGGPAGIRSVMEAFAAGLPLPGVLSRGLVVFILALFAFTTVVGWSFYGVSCLNFLTGDHRPAQLAYLTIYALTVLLAPCFPVQSLWMAANVCNGLMAVPNLIAILLLSPVVCLDARDIINSKKFTLLPGRRRRRNGDSLSGRPGTGLCKTGGRPVHR